MRFLSGMRALAAAFLVVGLGLTGVAATTAPASAAGNDAVQQLGGCLASGGQGDLLVVLDTSASLQKTDPEADRVTAATYLVRQLQSYAEKSGAKLDIAIAGFADKFQVTKAWTALDGTSQGDLVAALEDYRQQDNGFETDYWAAASGARKYLAAKADDEARHCQAWIWFSDGMFDLDKRDTGSERDKYGVTKAYGPDVELTTAANESRIEAAGRTDLCRKGGVADQLRVQGIVTLAVGLKADSGADFSLMNGLATGSAVKGDPCGRLTKGPVGAFMLADQIGDLLFAFDALSDPDHPPTRQQSRLCKGSVCPAGTHQFVLDPTISKVHILAGADVRGYRVVLTGPNHGQRITLNPGSGPATETFPGFTASTEWLSDEAVQIDIARRSDRGWTGQWQLAFVGTETSGGTAKSNIHLYGDIEPAWLDADSTKLMTGESADLRLGLVRSGTSESLDLATIASDVSVDAALRYPNGATVPVARGLRKSDLAKPLQLDLKGAEPGDAALQLALRLTTAAIDGPGGRRIPGTELEAQAVEYPVTIRTPPDFPKVGNVVSFGRTEELGDHKADLPIQGDGCVWLQGKAASLTLPEGVSGVGVTSSADSATSCVKGALPLTLSTNEVGSGLVSGEITVMTRPAAAEVEPVPVTVRYELEMQKPRNEAVFWPLLVGITLAGVLIPVALLYLMKWRTAQIPGNSILVGSLHGSVDQHSAFLATGSLTEQAMRGFTLTGTDRRRLPLNSLSEIRTKVGWGLTEPGYALVQGQPSASSANPSTTRRGTAARLPLAVQDRWVVLLDTANPHAGPIEVVFLLSPTSGKLQELLVDARNRVPEVVEQLRDRVNSDGGSATAGAGAGGAAAAEAEWGLSPSPGGSGSNSSDDWGSSTYSGNGSSTQHTGSSGTGSPNGSWDEW